jgi:hypothetical protein
MASTLLFRNDPQDRRAIGQDKQWHSKGSACSADESIASDLFMAMARKERL